MNVSHLAYKFRMDYRISQMPLDFDRLVYTLQRHFRILKYSEARDELLKRECFGCTLDLGGFALTDEFGQTTIYISDYINREERLSVLLHELGHVVCGHCRMLGPVVGYGGAGNPAQEKEANEFALSVRAPVCYLAKLRVRSPEDIRAVAGVSEEDACNLFKKVTKYRKEDHLVTRQEKNLVKMMSGSGEKPSFHPGEKRLKQIGAAALIALVLVLGICCCAPYFSDDEKLPAFSYGSGEKLGGSISKASAESEVEGPSAVSKPPPEEQDLSSQQNPPVAAEKAETFWVTRYGECYHREDCFHLYGKDDLREMTRQDAKEEGLRACTDCRPDDE